MWFNYGLVENIGGKYLIFLIVRIFSDMGILMIVFVINIGNKWKNVEIDLYVVNNMMVCLIW